MSYELVGDELITNDDFRDFTFANAVRLFGRQSTTSFEGTPVAGAAAEVLGKGVGPRSRGIDPTLTRLPRIPRSGGRHP
jgi:hypothetical protein